MIYKDKLKKLRDDNDLKQYEVAKILNIYKGGYNQYETEYLVMPIKHLNTLANYYNVSIDYLFSFTNIENYNNSQKDFDLTKSSLRLKEIRKENKLTQERLAKELNVDRSVLSKFERGIYPISTPFLYDICKKYNVSADWLLGKVDSPKGY